MGSSICIELECCSCLPQDCEGSIELEIVPLTKDLNHSEVLKGTTDFRTYNSEYGEGIDLKDKGLVYATQEELKELTEVAIILEKKRKSGAKTAQTLVLWDKIESTVSGGKLTFS